MTHPFVHAVIPSPSIAQTPCQIRQVRWTLPTLPCERCGRIAPRVWEVGRTAIDVDLDGPVLLAVGVSVHHCPGCGRYCRAQPPFLRRGAIYTNRVVAKALRAVFEDGLAFRHVPDWLARECWVHPSERLVRAWCRAYSAGLEDQQSYLPWVAQEFSGLLCVDEVYQNQLALLLAVDPAAPGGDRLIGYHLVEGSVDHADVAAFLTRLKDAGICPEEVITDGSALYPAVLAEVWPTAAHQLCLFHETRHVTQAVVAVLSLARHAVPTPPLSARQGRGGGPVSADPPTPHRDDPATQRWHLRRARRHGELAHVHALRRQGYSLRAIARQTGRQRHTIRAWLAQEIPALSAETKQVVAQVATHGEGSWRRRRFTPAAQARLHALAQQGLSQAAIARITGLHRVTVARWLRADAATQAAPAADQQTSASAGAGQPGQTLPAAGPPPPAPWTSWEQVRHVREALKEHRWLVLRRPDRLSAEQHAQVDALVASPLGEFVGLARRFLLDWYALWRTEEGHRRSLADAHQRYADWRSNTDYRALAPLRQVQDRMSPTRFARLTPFLRHAHWEATNNGAERMGRVFRHAQAPHFRLRTPAAIDAALRVVAAHAKQRATAPPAPLPRLCPRGRPPRLAVAHPRSA